MGIATQYRVNAPAVISNVIDDEVVIINLENGCYYSLRDSGADIWHLIQQGATEQQTAELLAARYAIAPVTADTDVRAVFAELTRESLICAADSAGGVPDRSALADSLPVLTSPAYRKPLFEKHSDMAELLLLDPIHDVPDTGWPMNKRGN